MTIKSWLATNIGRSAYWFLTRFTQGGSSLPGKLALLIDPDILSKLADNYQVAIVTGTNGKTLTTALAVAALKTLDPHIVTNASGSNMIQGLTGAFLNASSTNQSGKHLAVLEVDEGSLEKVVPLLKPAVFLHTNIFEDQLDRYGSIEAVYQKLIEAAASFPDATVISNGDIPLMDPSSLRNPVYYFGSADAVLKPKTETSQTCPHCGHHLDYIGIAYAEQGHYQCQHCGYKRPQLDYQITSIDHVGLTESQFTLDNHSFTLPHAGVYNIYNAIAAYSLARYMGADVADIQTAFANSGRVYGRQEMIEIEDKKVTLHLVKNTVGLNQVINLLKLETQPFDWIMIINNNDSDGTDPSWLNDVNYEAAKALLFDRIIVSGMVKDELKDILSQSPLQTSPIKQADNYDQLIEEIIQSPYQQIHITMNYTAMFEIRKALADKGYLK